MGDSLRVDDNGETYIDYTTMSQRDILLRASNYIATQAEREEAAWALKSALAQKRDLTPVDFSTVKADLITRACVLSSTRERRDASAAVLALLSRIEPAWNEKDLQGIDVQSLPDQQAIRNQEEGWKAKLQPSLGRSPFPEVRQNALEVLHFLGKYKIAPKTSGNK
jgi:hypothetical protein